MRPQVRRWLRRENPYRRRLKSAIACRESTFLNCEFATSADTWKPEKEITFPKLETWEKCIYLYYHFLKIFVRKSVCIIFLKLLLCFLKLLVSKSELQISNIYQYMIYTIYRKRYHNPEIKSVLIVIIKNVKSSLIVIKQFNLININWLIRLETS